MKKFKWNKDLLETLIILWEQSENLYKTNHKYYNDVKKREASLKKIYLELKSLDDDGNLTLEEVKRKLHMLRIQYSREFTRHLQSCKNSNQTLDDFYVPRLWCYDQLIFLRSHYNNLKAAQTDKKKKEEENLARAYYVRPRKRKKANAPLDLENQLLAVKELIKNRPENKFNWLGKQIVVELSHIKDESVKEETSTALQEILRKIKEENQTLEPSSPASSEKDKSVESAQHSAKVCKTEMDEYSEDSMQFIDDESTEKDHSVSRQQISKLNSNDELNTYDEDDEEANNPLSPTNNANSVNTDIDDIILEEDDVIVPKEEYVRDSLKRHRPTRRSEKLVTLHEEKAKAETVYFKKKAAYFQKQTENLDIQRKLMILQAQKLRLEIENIRNGY